MSNLPVSHQKNEYKHLLVFDTIALLSADDSDREQVWRNNQKLGDCYIPGATYAEISKLAQDYKKPKDQARARAFLEFVGKERRYQIQPKEDNRQIPLDNEKDRQIVACAYRLSQENPNCVVILVTYDQTMKGLIGQSRLPNFCTLTAKDLSDWFHLDYYRNKVPQAVSDTYQRMKQFPSNSFKPTTGHKENQHHPFPKEQKKQLRNIQQTTEKPILKGVSQSANKSEQNSSHTSTSSKQKKPSLNPWLIAIAAACVAVVALSGINSFMGNNSTSIVAQERVDNQPVEATPANLITIAEAAIIQFQQTKEPSVLKSPLNELQTLKNKQGVRLDNEGEQRLSRLKHKYAIEVLASSGQKAEAVKMLKEVSANYSEYKDVEKWIAKLEK
jgi:hypothetical protein